MHATCRLGLLVLALADASHTCSGRVDTRFTARPHLCRQLERASCEAFFIRLDGITRPCVRTRGKRGSCTAGPRALCARRPPVARKLGMQATLARRRQRRMLQRAVENRLGKPCRSSVVGDSRFADCEDWCTSSSNASSSLDSCKYCKCRACRSCYTMRLPAWATSTLAGLRACAQSQIEISIA